MVRRPRIHEAVDANIQNRDQIIANYQDKANRCSCALEVMLKVGTSKDMMVDVIRDLIAGLNN